MPPTRRANLRRKTLIVMLKEPRPGRVKTRLGRDIGLVPAAWWFRHQVNRLLRAVADPRWDVVLAVSPDYPGLTSRVWPRQFLRVPQGRGNLGDRMRRLMQGAPPGPVCVIGADIPGINRAAISEAFAALGSADVVFGPATDGGYWLVGVTRFPAGLFDGVRWSTQTALDDTVASLNGQYIAFVRTLRDVDTVEDLRMTSVASRDS